MLYASSYLPSIGGREVVVHQLALAYQELGHDVRVVGPGAWWNSRKIKFPYPLHRWPRIPLLTKEGAWLLQLLLVKILYRPDIIHAHSTYPTGYIAARLKKFLKFPLIITPHGQDIHVIPEINFGHRLNPVLDKKIQYALDAAEKITAISDSVAKSIKQTNVAADKIVSIPNGVDLKRFQGKQKSDIYKYLNIPADSQLILTTGNYHPRKGHEVLIESIQQAIKTEARIVLVIVGRTSEQLIAKVNAEGLSAHVKFTGPLGVPLDISEEQEDILAALLNNVKIYVSSSVNEGAEGMSLALLEAMSAGVCPIVTDISGNRDIVINGKNGVVVPPSSPGEMADAIIQVLHDENKRIELKNNAIELAKNFGWLEIAKKYISLYEMVISV